MAATITQKQIETLRAHVARRTPARRVRTREEAVRFVDEMGFCFFWPIKGYELMPNLFHAIAGRIRDVPNEHDDPDISKCWGWKDEALGAKQWYYAKLLAKRATLVSIELLPYFYALSPNYGDEGDYLQEYKEGLLSREARDVYEALYQKGALDTIRLRREAHMSAENAKARFERALVELQVGMKVLPVGVAEAGAWHYAFVYELVPRHFADVTAQARAISRGEARARLVAQFVDNAVAAAQSEIARTFAVLKWTQRELERTLEGLIEQGTLARITLPRQAVETFVSTKALAASS